MADCLFCDIVTGREEKKFIYGNDSFASFLDLNPVSDGHSLVTPRRHVVSLFDLTEEEWADLQDALGRTKEFVDKEYKPDAYNIGVNDGEEAGQTVFHLHIHVIPRYEGDVPNPRGGVRYIIPGKGDYPR